MESGLETYQSLTSDSSEPRPTFSAEPTHTQSRQAAGSKLDWFVLLSILLISCGLYLSTFPREFTNWDDPEYIVNNSLIRSLSLQKLNKIITEPYFANYAPLTLLSYALDYRLWKLNPVGYHLHNLLLHLGCVTT